MLADSFGRQMETLRVSVTDRCNFRCRYCMPPEGLDWLPRHSYLSFEQIERIARIFLELGGSRLRLTGGEPLLRDHLADLVRRLSPLPGLQSMGLTTNGSKLKPQAQGLWDAGLRSINISIDSLNPCKFEWISLSDAFTTVWDGLYEALRIGFTIKINTVVLKGITRRDVMELMDLAVRHDIEVRFIEFMPLCGTGWKPDLCFPVQTVRNWIAEKWGLFDSANSSRVCCAPRQSRGLLSPIARGSQPAESFHLSGGRGRVGFIESLTQPFCGRCSRLRLSADGVIYPCLFSKKGYDIKPHVNDDTALREHLQRAVWEKPAGHGNLAHDEWRADDMPMIHSIGG